MSKSASDLSIVDNGDADWKACSYIKDWCELFKAIDIVTGYFEISALLGARRQMASAFARWLGFARTGGNIENAARSLINGLLPRRGA